MQDMLESLKYVTTRRAFRYYTVWSVYFLIVAIVLSLLRVPLFLPAATVNVALTSIIGFAFYAYAEPHEDFNASLESGVQIYTKPDHITRRSGQFITHVLPLFLAFLSITVLQPYFKQPHPLISLTFIVIFSTIYMSVPHRGKKGLQKLRFVYGVHYLKAISAIVLLSALMLWGLFKYRLEGPLTCPTR